MLIRSGTQENIKATVFISTSVGQKWWKSGFSLESLRSDPKNTWAMGTTKPQRLALVTVPNTYLKKLRLSHDILRYLWKYHDIDWYFFQFSQTLRYFAERLWECHQWEWECFTWPSKLPHSTLNSLTLNTQSYHTLKASRYSKLPDTQSCQIVRLYWKS